MEIMSYNNLALVLIKDKKKYTGRWRFNVYRGEENIGVVGYKEREDRVYVDSSKGHTVLRDIVNKYGRTNHLKDRVLEQISLILLEKEILE